MSFPRRIGVGERDDEYHCAQYGKNDKQRAKRNCVDSLHHLLATVLSGMWWVFTDLLVIIHGSLFWIH